MSTVVLWTGGKDSALALYRTLDEEQPIDSLVTFIPPGVPDFHAHPLWEMAVQAKALGIRHETIPVREPYRESYVSALTKLAIRGVSRVVTGDIDFVDGYPNWIVECSRGLTFDVSRPLWQAPREELLQELVARGIEAKISYINDLRLPSSWLGRIINERFIRDIVDLADGTNIDICGENGEYHTMVIRFPGSGELFR